MSCSTCECGAGREGRAGALWGRRLLQIGLLVLFVDLMAVFFWEGFDLRRLAWDLTTPVRFGYDINRNYMLGQESVRDGWLNIYENQLQQGRDSTTKINYTPLRLAVFHWWGAWNNGHVQRPGEWQPEHEFNAFLMYFNTTSELMAAVAAFLLVRHWVRRTWRPKGGMLGAVPGAWVGVGRATAAFVLVWLSPAMVIMGHGWPSPNGWVVPWFLWTVLLCCWEWWFVAGLVMGLGAMFQGQQLFVAPMFILWPLFAGQPGRALRWVSGFGLSFMLVASGWMLTRRPDMASPLREWNWEALRWVGASVGLMALVVMRPRRWAMPEEELGRMEEEGRGGCGRMRKWAGAVRGAWRKVFLLTAQQSAWKHPLTWTGLAAAAAAIPVIAGPLGLTWRWTVAVGLATGLAWFAPRRFGRYLVAGVAAATLLLCIWAFNSSTAWWELGFMYGTERHPSMTVGTANNLCALLEQFGWRDVHEEMFVIPSRLLLGLAKADFRVEMTVLMLGIYGVMLVATCGAIALQWRRNDRNFLIAMATPWILFYTIPAQIHERYLVFAAGAAACVIGCSVGMMLLDVFFILLTYIQTSQCMMQTNRIGPGGYDLNHPLFNIEVAGWYRSIRPDISYAVVLACIIFFYVSFTRYRRIVKVKGQAEERVEAVAAGEAMAQPA